jgi:hypothetical protein
MSDGFKFNYNETEQAITNVARETSNLLQEVEEISKIINVSQQDWQGTTKDAYVNKLTETKKELSEFIDTTFTEYMNKEKTRLSAHADDEGANAGKADVLDRQ